MKTAIATKIPADKSQSWPRLVEQWSIKGDVSDLCKRVRQEINTHGYAYIPYAIPKACFQQICMAMGTLESIADLLIDPERDRLQQEKRREKGRGDRPSRYQTSTFGFHTDVPIVGIMGFYCFVQDRKDGALQLIDVAHVHEFFTAAEREILERTNLKWSILQNGVETTFECPLLSMGRDQYRLYYAPWLAKDSYPKEQEILMEKFAHFVERMAEENLISVRLKEGEAVFVDNRRVLHGRGPLEENSKRHIWRIRLYA